ncbi:GNAT family N-acetyltransferase [Pseudomonas sp. RIT-PI-AD]|uniref:GNAT family N-acetyltransferase n=1 Tax=Pseudomonas sp. RIT-PI-AD TaxID=3035294 RepID=UPI0021D954C4|nr:GNAT family N-acetyltransferase [Pseudomonas sp. RIT-PI-AD]
MSITWLSHPHRELDTATLYAILALRAQVFVVEQKCPYLDVDGEDLQGDTCHLSAWEDGQLLAYLRLLDPARHDGEVIFGRVVTAPQARGRGLGHGLMAHALEVAAQRWPGQPLYLSAQAHLQEYYGRYGFAAVTGVYLEDDIPHIGMRRD